MDRNGARITIKFGQAEKPLNVAATPKPNLEPAPVKMEDKPPIELESEIIQQTWEQPKNSHKELAVSKEVFISEDENFGPKYVRESAEKPARKKHRGRGIGRGKAVAVTGSVAGAIVVGLIFGTIVLTFFKSGGIDQAKTVTKVPATTPTAAAVASTPSNTTSVESTTPAQKQSGNGVGSKISITIPSYSYFVVQAGVFQDQASATPILDKIKAHTWPHELMGEKPQYLILGMAVNRDNALALANQFKDLDVFIKEWKEDSKTLSIPLRDGAKTTQDEWNHFFDKETEFIKVMGQTIGQGLVDGKIKDDTFQSITSAHRDLLQAGRDLINKLPDSYQEQGDHLLNDYTKIVTAMESYQKQPGEGYLWQAEQGMLDAFASKKQLLSSFK